MKSKVSETAIIYPNVSIGNNVIIEDFCIIGLPFNGIKEEKTVIGDGAIIRSGTYIYAGNQIGKNFHTGNKVNIRELNSIGDNVSIGTLSVIEHNITIHNGVRIHTQAFIPEYTIIEKNCWIGPNVVLTNAKYPKHPKVKENLNGVYIQQNVKIGANTTLLPGVVIGKHSLIGAGSVVTKNVAARMIVAGSPAKEIRKVDY
jgi:acetyltransferase-like isoleucine patch superfamily enzyme